MFTSEGPHIVMSRTDAQNGLDFHFNKIDKENKVCYLMGDINIDLLKSESCDYSNSLLSNSSHFHFLFLHLLQNKPELLHIQPHLSIIFSRTILKNLTEL